ncbi:hypothetical protein GCM10027445_19130 [Amycolatopsis endophytica]|uniref:HigA family addiction module antitoxin n=1 Tax=Amycolatopsis endophytica TaxID=860233 RepID=UPI0015CBD319|nr:HigA family addiction module antitoxin [Amycolatopsis endophytica]
MSDLLEPIHPGEILLEEFLAPLGITQHKLAVLIHVPPRRINEIVHGKRAVTADTALRLSRFFGTSDQFWMSLQARYDLERARDRIGPEVADIHPLNETGLAKAWPRTADAPRGGGRCGTGHPRAGVTSSVRRPASRGPRGSRGSPASRRRSPASSPWS